MLKTKRRGALGDNPLDALIPTKRAQAASKASRRGLAPSGTTPRPPAPQPGYEETHVRATFHLPVGLVDELRDVVVALSGPPARLTLARLAEDAFRRELARLKKEHNRGKDFPKREGELRGGRPIGS